MTSRLLEEGSKSIAELISDGQWEEAARQLEGVAETTDQLVLLVKLYYLASDWDRSYQTIQLLLRRDPSAPVMLTCSDLLTSLERSTESLFLREQLVRSRALPSPTSFSGVLIPLLTCSMQQCGAEHPIVQHFRSEFANLADAEAPDHSRAQSVFAYLHWETLFARDAPRKDVLRKLGSIYGSPRTESPYYVTPWNVDPTLQHRKLRVGYLSSHLYDHAVSMFTYGMLAAHRSSECEVFVYITSKRRDRYRTAIESLKNVLFRAFEGPDDAETIAATIHGDKLDVLVELVGHTSDGVQEVLRHHPAPLVVSMVGYPGTSYLPCIDLRLVNQETHHPETNEFTERLLVLPSGFPPQTYMPIFARTCMRGLRPIASETRTIRIACFAFPGKLGGDDYDMMAEILHQVPSAVLVLRYRTYLCPYFRTFVFSQFQARGILSERIDLWPQDALQHQDMMAFYDSIDLAIDTYPFNGGTITCDAIYCGVPVVTRKGHCYKSSMGAAILTSVGCPELITHDRDTFVRTVVELARDETRLAEYHRTLPMRFQSCSIGNPNLFTPLFENVLRIALLNPPQDHTPSFA
jgi:predicted O-linked N-acetylglucosamine transferase (SPINDLY family)